MISKGEDEPEEDDEGTIDLQGLSPSGVVVNFVELWVNGDFELAYKLLSANSALRESLSKDDWVERRASPGLMK